MTRRSILEYAQALRSRYYKASKEEKGKMLDEFTKVTGLHRKAAISNCLQTAIGKRHGVRSLRTALSITSNFLIQATRAIFLALPLDSNL